MDETKDSLFSKHKTEDVIQETTVTIDLEHKLQISTYLRRKKPRELRKRFYHLLNSKNIELYCMIFTCMIETSLKKECRSETTNVFTIHFAIL